MGATFPVGFIGVLAVLAFIALTVQSRPYRDGVITTGTVVSTKAETSRFNTSSGRRTMRTYAPVVEYTDSVGVTHSVTSSLSGGVPPTIGSTVRVSYRSSDPARARILGDSHSRVGQYLFLVVGIGFLGAAVYLAQR